ncbi:patatin-like phospholipase family protein [Parasphaerochaeta coccoides]|uniref:Patatin n=1 Tax=Parasphaerochaeta coccoides (strain ATCC BAA-1237 / DSM 17374 / SPN1) TaxID=760011 RepID=F4GH52_PARC1|nr:patatin-like phospholipase family protein [Parasphaerochaeta coccoides]AEC01527.1 Patatin [Parasphaerochaeta coccoides DSM 17374]
MFQRPVRKISVLATILMFFILCLPVAAEGGLSTEIPPVTQVFDAFSGELFASPYPISYGEEGFRTRILERTQGKRDPIGLVLSGGSARAMAHIGVLMYMEEAGIIPDFIISNSMGSIVALLYSAGFSPNQISDILTETDMSGLFDLVLPTKGGLLSLSRFESLLAAHIGHDMKIENSLVPVMIVVEDLVTKRQVHIMEGDYATALAASFAIPVYFDPVEYRGHLLIDGGITNLTPLSFAYEYTDTVIVSTTFYDVDTLNLRNPLTVLNVSLDIGKRREGVAEMYRYAESLLWIRPDVEKISFMEFSKAAEIIGKGYEAAKAQGEALAVLADSSLEVSSLDQIRADRAKDIQRVRAQKQIFGHTTAARTSGALSFGFESHGYPSSGQYLREDTALGLEYKMLSGDLEVSMLGGGGARIRSNAELSIHPLLGAHADFYPISFLRLSADVAGFLAGNSNLVSDIYASAGAEFRQILADGNLVLSLAGIAEMSFQVVRKSPEQEFLLTAGFYGSWFLQNSLLSKPLFFSLLYQLYGHGANPRLRNFAGGNLSSAFRLGKLFTLDAKVSVRFALDGQGDVPYFAQDGYRSRLISLLRRGRSSTNLGSPFLVTGSFYVGIVPFAVNPSFGELVLLDQPRLGPYVDLLWGDGLVPSVAIGMQVDMTMKIIGLKEFPLAVYAGYEFSRKQPSNGGMVWGVSFNL